MINLGAFGLGFVLPIVELRELYFFVDTIVLWEVPVILTRHGEYVLALLVAVLGIGYPIAKSLVYAFAWQWPRLTAALGSVSAISFFDVFMIAILIFVAKGSLAADAETAIGIYFLLFFAISSKALEWAYARSVGAAR
jgi:uncharacterized paraquat-inducible protein A